MNRYFQDSESAPWWRSRNWTDTAQICLNGHLINAASEYNPIKNKKHCPECGEPTLTTCPQCNSKILGKIHYVNVFGGSQYKMPGFCSECGKPYPWTQRTLKAAKEMLEMQEVWQQLEQEQAKEVEESLTVGAARLKKFMMRLGNGAGDVLKDLITDIASETAKKVLFAK